jgi:hypothetical protein
LAGAVAGLAAMARCNKPENASQPNPHETLRRNPRLVKIGVMVEHECPDELLIKSLNLRPQYIRQLNRIWMGCSPQCGASTRKYERK